MFLRLSSLLPCVRESSFGSEVFVHAKKNAAQNQISGPTRQPLTETRLFTASAPTSTDSTKSLVRTPPCKSGTQNKSAGQRGNRLQMTPVSSLGQIHLFSRQEPQQVMESGTQTTQSAGREATAYRSSGAIVVLLFSSSPPSHISAVREVGRHIRMEKRNKQTRSAGLRLPLTSLQRDSSPSSSRPKAPLHIHRACKWRNTEQISGPGRQPLTRAPPLSTLRSKHSVNSATVGDAWLAQTTEHPAGAGAYTFLVSDRFTARCSFHHLRRRALLGGKALASSTGFHTTQRRPAQSLTEHTGRFIGFGRSHSTALLRGCLTSQTQCCLRTSAYNNPRRESTSRLCNEQGGAGWAVFLAVSVLHKMQVSGNRAGTLISQASA